MATQRLSIDEAARVLGISARTVRRRIREGSLTAEREPTAQGFRYVVLLDGVDTGDDTGSPAPGQPGSHEVDALRALLTEVTGERDWLRGRVEDLTRQAEQFQVLLLRAEEDRRRLVPPGQADSQRVDAGMTPGSQASTQPSRRPSLPGLLWQWWNAR